MPFLKFCGLVGSCLILALTGPSPAQTANATPKSLPPYKDIVVLHDVVIGKGGGRDLHAEIAYPKDAPTPLPAVICIHGGGWMAGSHLQEPIQLLAREGYFAASIEYRLSGEAQWPAQIQDCKLGVRWLRANATQYNVDPFHIGAWGESAGGHLVACLGTMADVKEYEGDGGYPGVSSAVQAVVDFYGPTDFTDPGIYTPQAISVTEKLFGVPEAQNPALWKSGSPIAYLKAGDPPVLLIHGDADTLVPLTQSTNYDAAMAKAGIPHQLIIVKNGVHGLRPTTGVTMDPSVTEFMHAAIAFLDKYLKMP